MEIRSGAKESLPEQRRRTGSPGHQGPVPTNARLQVLQDGGRHSGAHASDMQVPIQIWTRLVESPVV